MDSALPMVKDAIELYLEGMREAGLPVPEPVSSGQYVEVCAA